MNHPGRLMTWSMVGLVFVLSAALASHPASAVAPKRLLLVTTTVGFRHAAVPVQEQLFRQLATSSGDFTIVSTTDNPDYPSAPKVLQQYMSVEALKNYDAVAFLSTTGELPIPDTAGFLKWIADGHGFIGLHSATDTLHQTPEYIRMIGGEFAGHGSSHPAVPVTNMDPRHPITAGWGPSITINEEFYLFKNFDPAQVHLLLALPYQPYTADKQPGEYPVSWIKTYGTGRVFYTSLGHRADVLMPDPTIGSQDFNVRYNQASVASAVQTHILNGVRWALGLTTADAVPQVR